MILLNVKKELDHEKVVLSAEINSVKMGLNEVLFFSYPARFSEFVNETADPFFPALLIPCMLYNEELEVIPPISEKLFKSQFVLQDIFHKWHINSLNKVNVIAHEMHSGVRKKKEGNATFFSMGVDSMYSMLKYLPRNKPFKGMELTHLLFLKGLELPLSVYNKGQDIGVIKAIENIANHYCLELIAGETNIRDIFPISYEKYYFGPCLASAALSLSNGFNHLYIPSSNSYAQMWPDPSTPLTDPMWSTEQLSILHDGAEKERSEKITELLVKDQFTLDNLRVCVNNEGGIFNCCSCFKCVRTMITLEAIGKLKNCAAFPNPLPKDFAKQLRIYKKDNIDFAFENLKLSQKNGKKTIARILEREIIIGRIDALREGNSIAWLIKKIIKYLFYKIRARFVSYLGY